MGNYQNNSSEEKNVFYEDDGYEENDNLELYLNEDQEEFRPRGPLSFLPQKKHLIPAAVLYIIFYFLTSLAIRYNFLDSLTVSGNSILHDYEIWRLLTAVIVHHNFLHLLSNGFLFILFGWMLFAYFGYYIFPMASLIIGVITNLIVILFYDPNINLLGASGMIHGMVSLWIVFYIRFDRDNKIFIRIFRSIGFILIMLIPSTLNPQTSYLAHSAGFLTGLVTGLLLLPFVSVKKPT